MRLPENSAASFISDDYRIKILSCKTCNSRAAGEENYFLLPEVLITLYLKKPFVKIKLLRLDGLTKNTWLFIRQAFTYNHEWISRSVTKNKLNKFPWY
jgi:hypothetical protein